MKKYRYIIFGILSAMFSYASHAQASITYTGNALKVSAYDPSKRSVNYKEEKVDYLVWKALLQKNVLANGKVNYMGFKNDLPELNKFLRTLSNTKINSTWTKYDEMAYWINLYNAYTVKLILNNYPVNSIKEINNPWKTKFFRVNNQLLSLGDVEHKILRNFKEPRIHFAINCASRSCPRLIQIPYTSQNLIKLLDRQAKEFINDEFYNTITIYSVNVSRIFDWYKKDFKETHGSVINFINQYSNIAIGNQKNKGYKPYDWSLNENKN